MSHSITVKRTITVCIFTFLVLAIFNGPVLASEEKLKALTPETLNNATMPNTHTFVMNSTTNGADYKIYISFPLSYFKNDISSYPVLYVLDGNWLFLPATQIQGYLSFGKELPEMMVIGIGYPTDSIPEIQTLRRRDYLLKPLPDQPQTGKAEKFLPFIQKELIPIIESNFRVTTDRTIMGDGAGGTFGMYVLFKAPETFSRYLIISGGGPRWISPYEEEYSSRKKELPAKVFFSVGELQGKIVMGIGKMVERIKSRKYVGLTLSNMVLKNETRMSVWSTACNQGLRTLFKDYSPK